jgi:hypothetical protein
MKRLVLAMGVLAALALFWSEREPSNEQSKKIVCAYYSESCVPPAIFSRAYFRLLP